MGTKKSEGRTKKSEGHSKQAEEHKKVEKHKVEEIEEQLVKAMGKKCDIAKKIEGEKHRGLKKNPERIAELEQKLSSNNEKIAKLQRKNEKLKWSTILVFLSPTTCPGTVSKD